MRKGLGLVKRVEEGAQLVEVVLGLEGLQSIVGGYIERLEVFPGVDVWFNEEGKINGMEPNLYVVYNGDIVDVIMGDVVFLSHDSEGNSTGLTEEQALRLRKQHLRTAYATKEGKPAKVSLLALN